MKFASAKFGVFVLFAAAASAAIAQQNGTVEAHPNLVVRLDSGNIDVRGKAGQQAIEYVVKPHGHGSDHHPSVVVNVKGDTVEVRATSPVDLVLSVPQKFSQIAVKTGCGDVSVAELGARASVMTDGGQVNIDRVSGEVTARTSGGNVMFRSSGSDGSLNKLHTGGGNITVDAAGGDLIAETGGGNVDVTATRGNIKVRSGGGNIAVHQASGWADLQTAGGNVDLGDVGGWVNAQSGGGSIRLASAKGMVKAETSAGAIECRQLGSGLKAETGSGAIFAEYARNLHFSESKIESASGDVTVAVPENLGAVVKLIADNPWGHNIHAQFPAVHVINEHQEGMHAEGLMNGGGPLLLVETGNGNVELVKTK